MELQIGGVAKTEVGLISSQAYREWKIYVIESDQDFNFRLSIQNKVHRVFHLMLLLGPGKKAH